MLILYAVRKLIKNWANINNELGSENERVASCSRLKLGCYLNMKLHNISEFYEEIFSLSYTDLFFPLFVLISLHGKNLIDIQKIGTSLSLVTFSQIIFQTLEDRVCAIYEVNYCQQQKRIGELINNYITYTFYRI